MELKDYISIAISVIALLISFVSIYRTRKAYDLAIKQSHIDIKYKALAKAQVQQTTMFLLRERIGVITEKRDRDALKPLYRTLGELMESSNKGIERLSQFDSDKANPKDELEVRKILGLLSERDAILMSAEQKIQSAEKASRDIIEQTSG